MTDLFGNETDPQPKKRRKASKGRKPRKPSAPATPEELEIYNAYPYRVGRPVAIVSIRKALKGVDHACLLGRVQLFAKVLNGDTEYCPHPATWFNQERYNDDPSTWKREDRRNGHRPPPATEKDPHGWAVFLKAKYPAKAGTSYRYAPGYLKTEFGRGK